jgi:hypothetical protein
VSLSDNDWANVIKSAEDGGLSIAEWMRQNVCIQHAVTAAGIDIDAWVDWVLAMPPRETVKPTDWAAWKRRMPACNDE